MQRARRWSGSLPPFGQWLAAIAAIAILVGVSMLVFQRIADTTSSILVVLFLIGLYFLPAIVAARRDAAETNSVLVINFLFGWTFFGWVVALAMAVRQPSRKQKASGSSQDRVAPPVVESDTRQCPYCAKDIKKSAIRCPYCKRFS